MTLPVGSENGTTATGSIDALVVLVGLLLPPELTGAEGIQVLVDDEHAVDAPAELRGLLEFVGTPRPAPEVVAWLVDNGGTADLIDVLADAARVLVVPDDDPAAALEAFSGHVVVPTGWIVSDLDDRPLIVHVDHEPERSADAVPVSLLTVDALWGRDGGVDLPNVVEQLSTSADLAYGAAAAVVVHDVLELLANRLAFVGATGL